MSLEHIGVSWQQWSRPLPSDVQKRAQPSKTSEYVKATQHLDFRSYHPKIQLIVEILLQMMTLKQVSSNAQQNQLHPSQQLIELNAMTVLWLSLHHIL